MKAIVAVDNKWGIGKQNGMLFRLPADLKHFKATTSGKVVVMGRNTFLSLPSPLPDRVNVVLSSSLQSDRVNVVRTLSELKSFLSPFTEDEIFLIGGGLLYQTLIDCCSQAIVTRVNADGAAQVFFPCLETRSGWELIQASPPILTNGYELVIQTYINHSVKPFPDSQD